MPEKKKLNSTVPMRTPEGDLVFANKWDVDRRIKNDNWTVEGRFEQHVARVDSPVAEAIAKDAEAKAKAKKSKAKPAEGKPAADSKPADPAAAK